MMLTVSCPGYKHCENMLQLGPCFGRNLAVLSLTFEHESHLFTTEYILLRNFSGVKHPYHTKLLQNCSCSQIPINCQWLARLSLLIWYERTFFLLFLGVGSSFDLKIKLSLFLFLPEWDYRHVQGKSSFPMLLCGHIASHKDPPTSLWCHQVCTGGG